MKVHILSQFVKIIKSYKPHEDVAHGDLYGLVNSDNIYVFSCCLTAHQLQHDPTLILPSSFIKVGSLICSTKEQTFPSVAVGKIVLLCSHSINLLINDNGVSSLSQEFHQFEEKDIYDDFAVVKILYSLPILCGNKTADVKNFISDYKDELYSNTSYFKLKNSNIIISGDNCQPIEESSKDISTLPCYHVDGGSAVDGCCFELFFNKSVIKVPSAPVLQIDTNKFCVIKSILHGEVGLYLLKGTTLSSLSQHLSKAIANQLQLAEYWIQKQLHDRSLISTIRTYLMKPMEIGNLMMPIYPSEINETKLRDYRRQIHQTFLLSLITPIVKRVFSMQHKYLSDVLINPHLKVSKSGVKDGDVILVQGCYGYHHYMQDNFDDNKWGCAYRSLQTVISWFRMQGYTDKPILTHGQIQQILVDIKDKPSSFVGSRQWIGSTEVGFVLETYLNVNSRFITVNSGAEIADYGSDLAVHFQTAGTPIMIGGGVLAHTIIGVDWNCSTGDIKYLILDPHYTGSDNITQIVKQGWCGWKGKNFWNSKAYYNLCLPQRPICL